MEYALPARLIPRGESFMFGFRLCSVKAVDRQGGDDSDAVLGARGKQVGQENYLKSESGSQARQGVGVRP